MGLFDRLFGRKEEPKIEEVVKEALENLDLTEPGEEVEALGTEEVEVKNTEEIDQSSEFDETYSKEASESEEPVAETTTETVEPIATPHEEIQLEEETECHCCQEESELTEVEETKESAQEVAEFVAEEPESPVEEVASSESGEEEADQVQPDEMESDTSEEAEEDLVIEEIPPVQETVQEKYDRSLKKTRTGFGARLNAFFANFRSVDEEFFEELEELLIMSDVGVQVASNLTEELRYEAKLENAKKPDALRRVIIEKLVELYEKMDNTMKALTSKMV